MSIPTYLPFTVVAGSIATIVAVVVGVSRALGRSNWSANDRRRTVQTTASVLESGLARSAGVSFAQAPSYHGISWGLPILRSR